MLHLLSQLPCRNRYTEDWIGIWTRELKNLGLQFRMLGDTRPVIITKYFTDPNKALEYECNQIRTLSWYHPREIFCLDIDFPGLLSAAIPVLKLMNPKLKCFGYLHAGSWCNGDIFNETPGKKLLERAMFDIFDRIFVASYYHKGKIERYFGEKFDNLEVVGFPFYKKDVFRYVKPLSFEEKNGILINGRLEQSNIDLVDRIREEFENEEINVVSAENRREYYNLLNKAKIVISLKTEETFGIGQLEAYVLGSIPLCPNKYAYPEVIGDARLLHSDEEDLINKLTYLIGLKENCFRIDVEKYERVIPTCIATLNQEG